MENQKTALENIWGKDYMDKLPGWVKERSYCYAENTAQKDLLITGINPSCVGVNPVAFQLERSVRDGKLDGPHWRNVRNMLVGPGIDLRPRAAYLDIFYFRHTAQRCIKKELLNAPGWIEFATAQLKLTRDTMENVIKPKLIVVANRGSYAYWGKEPGYVWMGYTFKKVGETPRGELCEITGFQSSSERIAQDLTDTQLKGTRVLFSRSGRFLSRSKRPTAAFLQELLAHAS